MKDLPIILIGAGGHASVVLAVLQANQAEILGFCDPKYKTGERWRELLCLGSDLDATQHRPDQVLLANGLGSLPGNPLREHVYTQHQDMGYRFATLIHPSAILTDSLTLGEGSQVMAGAILQPGVSLGCNVIVNTGATVDHDCIVHDHVHIAPGVTLSGSVEVGRGAHIGTGANIIQNVQIGHAAVVGAGVTLTRNIGAETTVYPARPTMEQSRDKL